MNRIIRKRIIGISVLGILIVCGVLAKEFLKRDYMNLSDADKRWGHSQFDPEKFKAGNTKTKSTMVVSLIKGKTMLGKPLSEIRTILGDYTGHLWNDDIPAYVIEEGWRTRQDTWQIVFLPDANRKVVEIKIHKNCCDP